MTIEASLDFSFDDTKFYVVLDQHDFMGQLNIMSMTGKHLNLHNLHYNKIYFKRPNPKPGDVVLAVRGDDQINLLEAWFDKQKD